MGWPGKASKNVTFKLNSEGEGEAFWRGQRAKTCDGHEAGKSLPSWKKG